MGREMDADGAAEGAIVQKSQNSTRLAGCNSARGAGVLQRSSMAQRGLQRCEMQGVVAAAQRSVEGALVSDRGSFNIGSVSSLTRMSDVGWISYLLLSNWVAVQ